ncbi:unnamed protein product [Ectocarpus sp. 6 AP-2014]
MSKVLQMVFKPVEWILNWPDKDNLFLSKVYAPVDEETTRACEVVGALPEALNGTLARNGPNPKFKPKAGYHWYDGDGMVHSVRIKAGKATYSNRYVRTEKLRVEEEAGEPVAMNFGDMASMVVIPKMLLGFLKVKLGIVPDLDAAMETTANTSLDFHAGRLFALCEGGLPYALRVMCDGVIETVGQATFDGQMKAPFTAHPKKDPDTGKLHAFGYQFKDNNKPYITYYVLDTNGKLERQFPIVGIKRPIMMHDFAITKNYAVFLDLPLLFKPELILAGKVPIAFDETAGSRMGVLRLDASDSSEMLWFDMPQTYCALHVLNAWEETMEKTGGPAGIAPTKTPVIKIHTCDISRLTMDFRKLSYGVDQDELAILHTVTLNLDTGEVTRESVLPSSRTLSEGMDFPQLRRSLVGRKNRFGYCTVMDMKGDAIAEAKIDLQAATPEKAQVGQIDYEDGFVGGECIFIPSKPDDGDGDGRLEGGEDDGYLATFVSRKDGTGTSELRVFDAKTMNSEPVATVKLPARVPAGFHAIFVPEAELATQRQ